MVKPVESYRELSERFPGIEESDPNALGRFAFHAAHHYPPEEFEDGLTGEAHQSWHGGVEDVLREVRAWREGWGENADCSRLELAQRVRDEARQEYDTRQLRLNLEASNADEGYALVSDFLEKGGYKVQTFMAPSPLFPDGRFIRSDIQSTEDPDTGDLSFGVPFRASIVSGEGRSLDTDIEEYVQHGHSNQKAHERIAETLHKIDPINMDKLQELRVQYGAKAADLLCFQEKVEHLAQQLKGNSLAIDITIPPFKAVATDVYEAWLNGSPDFEDMIENVRLEVANFEQNIHDNSAGAVAVRSSAVKSEDSDEHTGAGVYKSVAVDPTDPEAFRKAVEEVYASARSESALTYQAGIGVENELMGLVIQSYQESASDSHRDTCYGHANSSGANPNIVDINTEAGQLLYDKNAVIGQLMERDQSRHYSSDLLHTHPDHNSSLREVVQETSTIPHAVVLAEKLFGKPMQVEFASEAIVQVRPIQVTESDEKILFPKNLNVIGECAASGLGDMELEELDEREDNSEKKGFVVFWKEYGFTINRSQAGYNVFPKEGAVIVIAPSHSGHIQALCREKGLLCFYPKKGSSIDHLEDYLDEDGGRGEEVKPARLRFVADGYDGKIYQISQS